MVLNVDDLVFRWALYAARLPSVPINVRAPGLIIVPFPSRATMSSMPLFWVCLLPVAKVFFPFRCLKISASYSLPKGVSSIRTAASRYSCHEWAINLLAKSDS